MTTAYLLFPLSLLIFIVSHGAAISLKASGERRVLQIITSNIAEAALIFAAVAGVYALASFVIVSVIGSSDVAVSQVHRFDELLKQSRKTLERVELTTWWFILALVLLAAFSLLDAPKKDIAGHPLLNRARSLALRLSSGLRRYRKLHKRLIMALIFAASFTFLPGMNAGDIERLMAARLDHAGKQLADIDDSYQQAVAAPLANAIVDRAADAMPAEYRRSIWRFPDGARHLDQRIEKVEKDYRISLEPLHRKVAPLIGRFQPVQRDRPAASASPREDAADRLLAELVASGSDVTFGDVDRVAAQAHEAKAAADRQDHRAELPGEIVEEVTGELLKPERLAHAAHNAAFAALIEEYPWLQPLLEVVSDSVAKVVAEKPFEAAWRPLARLFERRGGPQPITVSIDSRVAELAAVIVSDPAVIDVRGHEVLTVVIGDGATLDALSQEADEEFKRAYAALTGINRDRIEALKSGYPAPREAPSLSDEQKLASRVADTVMMIEEANAGPADKRDWLDALDKVLPGKDLDRVTDVQRQIRVASDLGETWRDLGPLLRDRGPRGSTVNPTIEDRVRDAIGERRGRGR